MRKFTLLVASLFITIGAMAQTFVEPQVGKYYKIKGDHSTLCWLTAELSSNSIKVSADESEAAVFERTANGFRVVSTGKYLGKNGDLISYVDSETTVTLHNTGDQANNEDKYAVKVDNNCWMYNNSTDQSPITHESSDWIGTIERFWGFVEVKIFVEPVVGKFYKIKGENSTHHWLTNEIVSTAANALKVSTSVAEAAIFLKTANGFQDVVSKKYFYYEGSGEITLNTTQSTVTLGDAKEVSAGTMYSIKLGTNNATLYNNDNDDTPTTHTGTFSANDETRWGFIEVEYDDAYNGKVFRLTTYSDNNFNKYLYQKTDGTTALYYNGTDDDTRAYWKFEIVTMGAYNIKNIHTGLYIGVATGDNNEVAMSKTAPGQYEVVTQVGTETSGSGKYYIKKVGADCSLHSTHSSGKVIGWHGGGLGNQYIFTEKSSFSHTLSVTDNGWATLCLGFNSIIPENVEVYAVTGVKGDNWLNLTPVTGVLPANTGVLVKAAQGNYDFAYTTESATLEGNKLSGALYDMSVSEEAYVLANGDNGIGLYSVVTSNGTFTCKANKAYLPASALTAEQQNSVCFRFDFDGTTAVEKVQIRNEKEAIYDLQGRRIDEITEPGIYIVNGVKVLVK